MSAERRERGARRASLVRESLWGLSSLIGGACLAFAPAYVEDAAPRAAFLAIAGLLVLTAYAWRMRAWPFVIINAISIYNWVQVI
jgi:hypothetical protein